VRDLRFLHGFVLVLFAPEDGGAKFLLNVSKYSTMRNDLEDLNLHWRFFSLTVPSLLVPSQHKFTLKCLRCFLGVIVFVTFKKHYARQMFQNVSAEKNRTLELPISHLCLNFYLFSWWCWSEMIYKEKCPSSVLANGTVLRNWHPLCNGPRLTVPGAVIFPIM
jgi:hypothetical protein